MKPTIIIARAIALISLITINSLAISVPAQQKLPICKPSAEQIYFVDSGQSVREVHPGSNGGNGYQLNILGTGVDKYQVVKEPYMSDLSLISANDSQAKWQIFFAPNNGQNISTVRMRAGECTGRVVREYRLTESVKLLDQ
jgi:hypothetical protein